MSIPSVHARKLLDVENLIDNIRNLNQALFMAASDIPDRDRMNGLQSVIDEINSKLLAVGERLEEIREDMQ